jgi:hypothetical protein
VAEVVVEADLRESDIPAGPDASSTVLGIFGQLVRETRLSLTSGARAALRMYRQSGPGLLAGFLFRFVWLEPKEFDIYIRLRHPIQAASEDDYRAAQIEAENVYSCLLEAVLRNADERFAPGDGLPAARTALAYVLPPRLVRSVE